MARFNSNGKKICVHDFNIHIMKDNWRGWVQHVKKQPGLKPDLILVQDLADVKQRKLLLGTLTKELGGTWDARGYADTWHPAVVWRKERFEKPKHRSWRGYGGASCSLNSDASPAVQVRLYDRLAKRWITCASFKTDPKAPATCPLANFKKVHANLSEAAWAGDLMIMGTDANESDRAGRGWSPWYTGVNLRLSPAGKPPNLGYCDPIFDVCDGDPKLLKKHVTREGGKRIDYLLARKKRGEVQFEDAATLPIGDEEGPWSDHNSVRCVVSY